MESIKKFFEEAWMVPESVARHFFWKERKKFFRRLQVMARARLPLNESIEELRKRAYESKSGVMYAALTSMSNRLRRGRTMAEAFSGWVPEEHIMLLEAGEKVGYNAFADAINDVLTLQSTTSGMIGKIIAGLMEPVIILVACYILVLWMASNFTDQIFSVMKIDPNRLTGQARQFYDVGQFAKSFWSMVVPALLLAFITAVFFSLPYTKGAVRRFLDNFVPPWSIYRAIVGASWMLTFAKLANARYSYEEILHRTSGLAKPWLRSRIKAIEYWLRRGSTLGEAMKRSGNNFPSKDLIDDIATFNNRPGFEDSLDIIAREWIDETSKRVDVLAFVMAGFGWVLTGVIMIWIFTSFDALQSQIMAIAKQSMG